jgi:hypothetical protein
MNTTGGRKGTAMGRTVTPTADVESTALEKENGDTTLGYLGRTALRREQCDMMPESWNGGARARHPMMSNN